MGPIPMVDELSNHEDLESGRCSQQSSSTSSLRSNISDSRPMHPNHHLALSTNIPPAPRGFQPETIAPNCLCYAVRIHVGCSGGPNLTYTFPKSAGEYRISHIVETEERQRASGIFNMC